MAEPMSDERLARLAGLAELPCTCRVADCERYTSALTAEQARELVAEAKRARAELAAQRTTIADELEAHAESIGWYEGGGVWAEALDVIRRGPQNGDDRG